MLEKILSQADWTREPRSPAQPTVHAPRTDRRRAGGGSGPLDSLVNFARMVIAVVGGMTIGAFVCAALGI